MKALLSAAVLAVLVAVPAHAKTSADFLPDTFVPWDSVIEEGQIIGQDPDPNVRLELRRDYPSINH